LLGSKAGPRVRWAGELSTACWAQSNKRSSGTTHSPASGGAMTPLVVASLEIPAQAGQGMLRSGGILGWGTKIPNQPIGIVRPQGAKRKATVPLVDDWTLVFMKVPLTAMSCHEKQNSCEDPVRLPEQLATPLLKEKAGLYLSGIESFPK